jgi:Zinc carboxypeptidase
MKSQNIPTPLQQKGYSSLTSHREMMTFLQAIDAQSTAIRIEYNANSAENKEIPIVLVSADGKDFNKKIRLMVFAQQHGNEASGKEACLILLSQLAQGLHADVLKKADIIIIPMVNPDGADADTRRNGVDTDLNRNHLILTENESRVIHHVYDKYLPHVTLDVHEYYPWDDTTSTFSLIRNYDEQFGISSNPNIGKAIRDFSRFTFLPSVKNDVQQEGYSFLEYTVGSITERERLRYSTCDVDDGRNGLGIYGSISFIAEGLNGPTSVDNIERRSKAQLSLINSLIRSSCSNSKEIKKLVKNERKRLKKTTEEIHLRMEHVGDGQELNLSLLNVKTGQLEPFDVKNFHPKIEVLESVERPLGYLVPANDPLLKSFMDNHHLYYELYAHNKKHELSVYQVETNQKETLEEMEVQNPKVKKLSNFDPVNPEFYFFVPTSQLKSTLIAIAFEPRSMLGLVNYEQYKYLLKEDAMFPIIRVESKK